MEEKKSSASGKGKLCAAVLPLKNLPMKIFLLSLKILLQPLKNLKKNSAYENISAASEKNFAD